MNMNTNRLIELTLVFFISLFSFSIGTFVGKKYSDNQHRLALLEPNKKLADAAAYETVVAATQTEKTATTTEGEITDADVAKLAEEFSSENEAIATATPTTTQATTLPAITTPARTTKDVKEISAVEAGTEREVASIPATAKSLHNYTVQVGSYPSEDEANKMTDSLVARGYKANAVPATVNGKTWYRVQVGMFKSLAEAQEYKKELVEKNRLTSAIVQKIGNPTN